MMREGGYHNDDYEYVPKKVYKCKEHERSDNLRNTSGIFLFFSIIGLIFSGFGFVFSEHDNGFLALVGLISLIVFFISGIINVHESDVCENIYES